MNEYGQNKEFSYTIVREHSRPYWVYYIRGTDGINFSIGFLSARVQGVKTLAELFKGYFVSIINDKEFLSRIRTANRPIDIIEHDFQCKNGLKFQLTIGYHRMNDITFRVDLDMFDNIIKYEEEPVKTEKVEEKHSEEVFE